MNCPTEFRPETYTEVKALPLRFTTHMAQATLLDHFRYYVYKLNHIFIYFYRYDMRDAVYMAGVQNSWSKGLYKVGTIGIEKLILHLRYEAGPIGNDAVHKLGASIALAWR